MRTARLWASTVFVIGVLLAAALAGCGGGGGSSSNSGNGSGTLTGPDPTTLSLSGTTPDGLTVTLAQDQATVSPGSDVHYTFTVTNSSAVPVTLQTANQAGTSTPLVPVSLTLADSTGASVYTLAAPAPTMPVTLQPNEFLTQTLTLTNTLRTVGRYQATATFQTGAAPTSLGPLVVTVR